MAQDFVGSNNVNLLVPSGQFGTRMSGGKDAASPRYIFTSLSPIARLISPEVDDPLLTHLEDDGVSIAPTQRITRDRHRLEHVGPFLRRQGRMGVRTCKTRRWRVSPVHPAVGPWIHWQDGPKGRRRRLPQHGKNKETLQKLRAN